MKNNGRIGLRREQWDYIIWGAVSAILNVGGFHLLIFVGADYKVANIIILIANRFFCYITNKIFVFRTKCENGIQLLKEIVSFFLARFATLLLDYFGVILLSEKVGLNVILSKMIFTFLVVIFNYLLGKWFVFKKSNKDVKEGMFCETDHTNTVL